jgi:SP family facilitated glucose transporter-like MFS transporter 3
MAFPGVGQHLVGFRKSVSKARNLSRLALFPSHSSIEREDSALSLSPTSLEQLPKFLSEPSFTSSLVFAVFCSVLASFQVGYNSGVLNVPELIIRNALLLDEFQWSLAVAIFCIGGLLGSLIGGKLADHIGRKNFLVANNVLFILGCLSEALAANFTMLTLGRFLIGSGCGGATVVVPLYLGEISPAHLRGSIGSMNQFAMVIGILIANILGNPLGTVDTWRYLLGLVLLPALFQIFLSPFLLESPLWLVCQRTNKCKILAEEVLSKFRGSEDVEFELECMIASKEEDERNHKGAESDWAALMNPLYRLPLAVGLFLQLAQQFSGINAVFYYSTGFFARAHVSDPWLASVLASSVNMLANALAIPLMDRIGRRVLLILSSAGMALSCIGLTFALYYMNQPGFEDSFILSTSSVFGILLYVTFFEIGLGPIPWLIGAEVFPARIRSVGMTVASIVNWSANFCVSLSFPHLNRALEHYTFLPFAVFLLCVIIFVLIWVPETRGKSLEEIQEEILGGKHFNDDGGDADSNSSRHSSYGSFEDLQAQGEAEFFLHPKSSRNIKLDGTAVGKGDDESQPSYLDVNFDEIESMHTP